MKAKSINNILGTLIVPVACFIALILFSFTVSWNPLSLIFFWFILIPFLATTLPKLYSKDAFKVRQSIFGIITFYFLMVFMIYKHYQSDYFAILLISLVFNIGLALLITWISKNVK